MGIDNTFRRYAVEAISIKDFLNRYYKPDRFRKLGELYEAALIVSHKEHFEKYGYDIISRHDSNTGEVVTWFGNN